MNKIKLPLFLLAVLISLPLLSSYVIADTKEVSFQLSSNPDESTIIVLRDKSLSIRALPKTEDFNFVMLKLIGEQGELPLKKSRNVRKAEYDVTFSLRDVPDGSYFIEFYISPEKYAAYISYTHGQFLCIKIEGSSVSFVESRALIENLELKNNQGNSDLSSYLKSSSKIQSDHPAIIELAVRISAGLSTDYDKAMAIHDWVCNNIWYDYDELNSGIPKENSVNETLDSRKGVCIDYASLTAALLRAVGIPAKLEAGYVFNVSFQEYKNSITRDKSNHVWNEAYIDGRWVIIDTTYDSNNTYKNGVFSTGTGMKNRKYFDITIEFLSADRFIND